MTIAACYLSDEGVVLGADSTVTMYVESSDTGIAMHHYDFAQKIFEFGDRGSTAAVLFWGLADLGKKSLRTFVAEVADEANDRKLGSLPEVSSLIASMFWADYRDAFAGPMERVRLLLDKGDQRTEDETSELYWRQEALSGGFCVGGRWGRKRQPGAFEVLFDPAPPDTPAPSPVRACEATFWGCPWLLERLIYGLDRNLFAAILDSGKWVGTAEDLVELIGDTALRRPRDLPLREAIDLIYASIYVTIKTMKFSQLPPVCGGPIEIAVVSSDREFRWVTHKEMAEALIERRATHG